MNKATTQPITKCARNYSSTYGTVTHPCTGGKFCKGDCKPKAMPTELDTNALLQQVAEYAGNTVFTEEYIDTAPVEDRHIEGLGIKLAVWAKWSPDKIMRVFQAALEDANCHTEAALVGKWLESEE